MFTYDSAITPNPPKNFEQLLAWTKETLGQFTDPILPDDLAGASFIRRLIMN